MTKRTNELTSLNEMMNALPVNRRLKILLRARLLTTQIRLSKKSKVYTRTGRRIQNATGKTY